MNTVPMMWVLPITGPDKDSGRTCYVCQLGSAPVVAAFIKTQSAERDKYIEYVQKLFDKHHALQAFIVILGRPDEEVKKQLIQLAAAKNISVPITVLDPEIGLPSSVPINDEADVTILLYRGRFFNKKIEYIPDGPNMMTEFLGDAPPSITQLSEDTLAGNNFSPDGILPEPDFSATFMAMDEAAEKMISRQ